MTKKNCVRSGITGPFIFCRPSDPGRGAAKNARVRGYLKFYVSYLIVEVSLSVLVDIYTYILRLRLF